MMENVVYIQAESACEVKHPDICIGDVACVYCKDSELKTKIEDLVLLHREPGDQKCYTVSFMALVACIDQSVSENIIVQNIGENEFIVTGKSQPTSRILVKSKVLLVTLITFFGSVFAIMTYNEDVDLTGVFDKIYASVMGMERTAPGILEASYAAGVAIGIIIFFNHFGKAKLSKEPTPMEIVMEQYEEDMTRTILKEASRKNETMNGWEK